MDNLDMMQAVAFAEEILSRQHQGIVLPYPGASEHAIAGLRDVLASLSKSEKE